MTSSLNWSQKIQSTLSYLTSLDLSLVMLGEEHDVILNNAHTVIHFLDSFLETRSLVAATPFLAPFTLLSQSEILVLLFSLRRIFHQLAASQIAHGTVYCWVDVVLAKMGNAVRHIVSQFQPQDSPATLFADHRNLEGIKAASQLPERWILLVRTITAPLSSPASRRLALLLVFGVCIVRPALIHEEPSQNDITVTELQNALPHIFQFFGNPATRGSLSNIPSDGHISPWTEQQRFEAAMLLAVITKFDKGAALNGLMPSSRHSMLLSIGEIVKPEGFVDVEDLIIPKRCLSIAEHILLGWGQLVPWLWHLGDDPRIAGHDVVIYISATWFLHFSHKLSPGLGSVDASAVILSFLKLSKAFISKNAPLANIPLPESLILSFHNGCQWLRSVPCHASTHSELGKLLLFTFPLLGYTSAELKLKSLTLDFLACLAIGDLKEIVHDAEQHPEEGMISQIDQVLQSTALKLSLPTLAVSSNLEEVVLVFNFVLVLWHSQVTGLILEDTIISLLQKALNVLLSEDVRSPPLLASTMSCIGSCEERYQDAVHSLVNLDSLFHLIIYRYPNNLLVESAFATLTCTTILLGSQALLVSLWNQMRDILLGIVKQSFTRCCPPFAILVAPCFCYSMSQIWSQSLESTRILLKSSPWTTQLGVELHKLHTQIFPELKKDPDERPEVYYYQHLQRKLTSTAAPLREILGTSHTTTVYSLPPRRLVPLRSERCFCLSVVY